MTKRLKKHHEQAAEKHARRPPIVAGDWQPHQPSLVRYTSSEQAPSIQLTSGVIDLTTHKNNIRQRSVVEVAASVENKKMVKCKHWPNCRETDEACPFVHPKDNCKYFPFCTQGDKCLYIHPEVLSTHPNLSRSPASTACPAPNRPATTSTRTGPWAHSAALRVCSKRWA